MKIKANFLSLSFKILGCFMIILALILNGIGVFNISITEVITGVLAMQALVIPIDISKIREIKQQ